MKHSEQLAWEARAGRPAAGAAFGAVLLLLASIVYRVSADSTAYTRDQDGQRLQAINDNPSDLVVIAALQALALLALAAVLLFLYRVIRYRRPELLKVAAVLAVLGPALLAALLIVGQVLVIGQASDFVNSPMKTEQRADELSRGGGLEVVGGVYAAGTLALAFALVLLGLNAMRSGVLSRFMGILAIIIGVLYVVPIFGEVGIVQLFWLGSLGILFLNRWPGGRGPAWDTGEARPWPTAAERQKAQAEKRSGSAGRDGERDELEPVGTATPSRNGGSAGTDGAEKDARTRPASRKRKKKRR